MVEEIGQVEALEKEIQVLQNELDQLRVNNQTTWHLLVQIGNRLQRSSTSIKTAVSSLLDFDIFWDETTQYEFLRDIDSSTDGLTDLIVLITLASRSQAKTLEIETEPNVIQEILTSLSNSFAVNGRDVQLVTQFQPDGKPIMVDFQYLIVALSLLLEVIIGEDKKVTQLTLQAVEEEESWRLSMSDLNPSLVIIMRQFFEQIDDLASVMAQVRPENALKILTADRILYLQDIKTCWRDADKNPDTLCLVVPAATKHN